jgi:hypothetical protein
MSCAAMDAKNVHMQALRFYLGLIHALHSCALFEVLRAREEASEKMMMASAFCAELQIETMMN